MNTNNKQNEINIKVNSFENIKEKRDLDRIKYVFNLFSNPNEKIKIIHVAGTNGKGSVCISLANILKEAGYKVGLFTSPHIIEVNERIKINNEDIDNETLKKIIDEVEDVLDRENIILTRFELYVVVAVLYFYRNTCDICIMEVGIGGEYDATNVITDKILTIITNIGFDHQEILGNTIEEIATAKAGIMKENVPLVLYDIKNAREVFINRAKALGTNLIISSFDGIIFNEDSFDYKEYKNVKTNLNGKYQIYNAVVVLDAVSILKKLSYNISDKNVYDGFKNTKWIGRYQILKEKPFVVIDGGHNEQCFRVITEELKNDIIKKNIKRLKIVLSFLNDKDVKSMLSIIDELKNNIDNLSYIITTLKYEKAYGINELEDIIKNINTNYEKADNIKAAINKAISDIKEDDMILFMGSLYMIEEVFDNIELLNKINL